MMTMKLIQFLITISLFVFVMSCETKPTIVYQTKYIVPPKAKCDYILRSYSDTNRYFPVLQVPTENMTKEQLDEIQLNNYYLYKYERLSWIAYRSCMEEYQKIIMKTDQL